MTAYLRIYLAALLACAAGHAAAQSYPAKAVHIVVPFPPVGAADLLSRALGKQLGETWGQAEGVGNRPGGRAHIRAAGVAERRPDGHPLLMAAVTTHPVNMSPYRQLGFRPQQHHAA